MRVVRRGAFVVGGEEDEFVVLPIDQVDVAVEIVADGPAPVGGAVDVPEAAAGFGLAGETQFTGAEIDDRESGGVFAGAGDAPRIVHARFAVAEDRDCDLVLGDDGFVRNPIIRRFGKKRAQAGAIGEDGPSALRGFAAGFPTEDDLAGDVGIGLHVADLKGHGDDEFNGAGF